MARVYGNQVGHWRAYMDYTVTDSPTSVTIQITAAGMQSVAWGFTITSGISTWIAVGDQTPYNGGGGFNSATGATVEQSYVSHTYTVAKTTSAQSVAVRVSTVNSSGYENGTSEGQAIVNIAAFASYAVAYNANGGSGAPSTQTKWYGQALTLSSIRPVRQGYSFSGWATSASGSVAYQPGASYTTNAAVTLYAVWESVYNAPTISSVEAYRCDASGDYSNTGTHIKASAGWSTGGANATNVSIDYRLAGTTEWTNAYSANPGTSSGTVVQTFGGSLDVDSVYDVRVTVSVSTGSSSATVQVAGQAMPISVRNSGLSVGICGRASDTGPGLTVHEPSTLLGGQRVAMCTGTNGTAGWLHVATVTVTEAWAGIALCMDFIRRTDDVPTQVCLRFVHESSTDPEVLALDWTGACGDVCVSKSATSTWELYVKKGSASDVIAVLDFYAPEQNGGYTVEFQTDQVASAPSGATYARPAQGTSTDVVVNSTYGVNATRSPAGQVTVCSEGSSPISSGAQWTTVALGTLPVGWRPSFDVLQAVPCGGGTVYLAVAPDGTVSYTRATPTTSSDGVYATVSFAARG